MIDKFHRRGYRAYADTRRSIRGQGPLQEHHLRSTVGHASDPPSGPPGWRTSTSSTARVWRRSRATLAIVCVSSRPHLLAQIGQAVAAQAHRPSELVLVTNSASYDEVDVEDALAFLNDGICGVRVLRRPADRSLGACLNDAMDSSTARFIAKFDDDDLYGPGYLADAMRAHAYAGATVVGKHACYRVSRCRGPHSAQIPGPRVRLLLHARRRHPRGRSGAGGRPPVSRHLFWARIEPSSSRCHRRGHSTFAADRFNFVQVRAADNTWEPSASTASSLARWIVAVELSTHTIDV